MSPTPLRTYLLVMLACAMWCLSLVGNDPDSILPPTYIVFFFTRPFVDSWRFHAQNRQLMWGSQPLAASSRQWRLDLNNDEISCGHGSVELKTGRVETRCIRMISHLPHELTD